MAVILCRALCDSLNPHNDLRGVPTVRPKLSMGCFKLINDITNYQYDNLYARSLYHSFNYEYFYSVKSIFLRPSKAVENRRKAQWVLALM